MSTTAPAARSSATAGACSRSASSAPRERSAPATGVELCGLDGTPFGRGISSVDAGELEARPPQVEAVHRDRLVLY